jgi:biopolymer transport protein ExbD
MGKLRFKYSSKLFLCRLVAVLTFAIGFAFVAFSTKEETSVVLKEETSNQVFLVKIPPFIDKNSSDELVYQSLIDYGILARPLSEMRRRNIPLPNVCGHLFVSLENDGKIMLNMEENGSLENTSFLKHRLETIFRERAENRVYETGNDKIVKAVIIKIPLSRKYNDVVKLIETAKESGAEPIILQIDQLSK